jgi:hypothetical protein
MTARAWRPIETAPKDGTPILVLAKAYHDGHCFHEARCSIAKWNMQGDSWTDQYGSLDGMDICQLTTTGTWSSGGGWFQPNEVTHWMPLPEPPQEPTQPSTADVEITSDEDLDKYFDDIQSAALAAIEASGNVVVPSSPSTAMRTAGARANYPLHSIDITDEVYRVMIAARPR